MSNPLISVLMPVFNAEKYLCEAIESILNQTLDDFEFLIINDGSTDNSRKIIASYRDSRIKLIDNERNLGLVASLNKGIELSKGKYIARMDSDDISHPERFEKQVRQIEAENADICGCHWLVMNESGKYIDARLVPLDRDSFTIFLMYVVPFAHGSVMMRKEFLQAHVLSYGGVKFAEDYYFWTSLYRHGAKFTNVNDFLFKYREYHLSFSKRLKNGNATDTKKIRRDFIKQNIDACRTTAHVMTSRYHTLSTTEKLYLILAVYKIFIYTRNLSVLKLIKEFDLKSLTLALLIIMKGF